METDTTSLFGDVIYSYTREQAIDDGVLVDITASALHEGIQVPVAMTAMVFGYCVDTKHGQTDAREGIHQVLKTMLKAGHALVQKGEYEDTVKFQVNLHGYDYSMWMKVTGEGEKGAPVMTIMMEDED